MDEAGGMNFVNEEVVITEKLGIISFSLLWFFSILFILPSVDGGNCCLMDGKVYARTHKHEATHPSFAPIKALYASLFQETQATGACWD